MGKKLDIAIALKIGADVSASVAKSFGETKSHLDKLARAANLANKEQAAAEAKYDKARQQKRQREALFGERKRLVAERGAAINEAESIRSQWKSSKAKADKFGGKDEIKRARDLERAFEQAGKKVDNATRALDKHKQKLAETGKESFTLANKTRELEKEVNKLGDAAARADKKLASAEGWNKLKSGALTFTSVAAGAVTAIGSVAAATVTALWKIDKGVAERSKSIEARAAGSGISTDTVQGMRILGKEKAGWEEAKTDRVVEQFLFNARKALRTGDKISSQALHDLGIHISDLDHKGRDNAIRVLFDSAKRNQDNKNAGDAFKTLMGRGGELFAKVGSGGAASLDATISREDGTFIDKSGFAKAKEFTEALTKIELKFQGIENIIAGKTFKPFADALNSAADTIAKHTPEIKEFAERFGKTIEDFVNSGALAKAIEKMGEVFGLGLKLTEKLMNAGSANAINAATVDGAESMAAKAKARSAEASRKVEAFANIPEEQLTPQQKLDRVKSKQEAAAAERARLNSDRAYLNAGFWNVALRKIPIVEEKGKEQDQRLADAISNTAREIASYDAERKNLEQQIARANTTINIHNNITTTADPQATGQAVADASLKTLNDLHYDSKP